MPPEELHTLSLIKPLIDKRDVGIGHI